MARLVCDGLTRPGSGGRCSSFGVFLAGSLALIAIGRPYCLPNTNWETMPCVFLARSFVGAGLCGCLWFLLRQGAPTGRRTMTPLLLDVQDAPVPFMGSDGRVHLVYELWMTNFSSADVSVEKVEVLGDGECSAESRRRRDRRAAAGCGQRESAGKLARECAGAAISPCDACAWSGDSDASFRIGSRCM